MTFDDFLIELVSGNVPPDEKIFAYFSDTDRPRLLNLLKRLQTARALDVGALSKSRTAANAAANSPRKHTIAKKKAVEGAKARLVGAIFERIVSLLCEDCKLFTAVTNVRTNTAEVDVLIELGPSASLVPMLKNAGTHLLGEAKCYTSGLKSEWVNELVGLMDQHHCNHSLLFLASPSKTLNVEHRHGLQLHATKGRTVVPFGMKQLTEIANGANFLSVLSKQYVQVQTGGTALAI